MSRLPQIEKIEKRYMRDVKLEDFRPGDTVRVHYEIVEGEKKRVQVFQGVVIRIKGRGKNRSGSFTVRKVSYQVGVERTFPFQSPNLVKVEVVTRGKVRKSRLYYMRGLMGKSARIQERIEASEEQVQPPPSEAESE